MNDKYIMYTNTILFILYAIIRGKGEISNYLNITNYTNTKKNVNFCMFV